LTLAFRVFLNPNNFSQLRQLCLVFVTKHGHDRGTRPVNKTQQADQER